MIQSGDTAHQFWLGRLKVGDGYKVVDSETGRELGTGRVASLSPYVGGRGRWHVR